MAFIIVNRVVVTGEAVSNPLKVLINSDHIVSVGSGINGISVIEFAGGESINVRETLDDMEDLLDAVGVDEEEPSK